LVLTKILMRNLQALSVDWYPKSREKGHLTATRNATEWCWYRHAALRLTPPIAWSIQAMRQEYLRPLCREPGLLRVQEACSNKITHLQGQVTRFLPRYEGTFSSTKLASAPFKRPHLAGLSIKRIEGPGDLLVSFPAVAPAPRIPGRFLFLALQDFGTHYASFDNAFSPPRNTWLLHH
jgi:hypothetical protein